MTKGTFKKSSKRKTTIGRFASRDAASGKFGAVSERTVIKREVLPPRGGRSGRTVVKGEALPPDGHRSVPATQAKNRFGEILETARDVGPVFIERHGQPQVVVLGIDAYKKLSSGERTQQEQQLDYWRREFNALHARMQTQKAREATDALFSATDAELNRREI